MNLISWTVLVLVLVAAAAAVFRIHRKRSSAEHCSGCALKGLCRK